MNKKNILPLLLFVSVLAVFPMVSALSVVTLTTPAADASISGSTQMLNATLDSSDGTVYNVSLYYMAPGTSTWTLIATVQNDSANDIMFNTTWDTTAFVDDDDYILNATAREIDNSVNSTDNNTGIDIDNGNPTSALAANHIHDGYKVGTGDTFQVAIDADATIGISSCIAFATNTGNSTVLAQSISASGNACSTSYTPATFGFVQGETYTLAVQATDGNGDNINSSTRSIKYMSSGEVIQVSTGDGEAVKGAITGAFDKIRNAITNFFNKIKSLLGL
jgi:hypothetical protein